MFFASCGDKYYTDDFLRNSDDKLCGYTWTEEVTALDVNGDLILEVNTLYFDGKGNGYGSGRKGIELYRALPGGKWESAPYKTETNRFDWKWIDNFEGLTLDYGGGKIAYFENVWVREYYLSGKLENVQVAYYRE